MQDFENIINSREEKRYNVRLALKLRTKESDPLNERRYSLANISMGGVFVNYRGDCHVDNIIGCKIYLGEQDMDFIVGDGHIVWFRIDKEELTPGFGFKFQHMDENSKNALKRFLRKLDY